MNPQFHWSLGSQFALEGGKLLLLSNVVGVFAALAMHRPPFVFAAGFLMAVAYFFLAYLTELHYGNGRPADAARFHKVCYSLAAGAALTFCLGVVMWTAFGG